MKNWFETLRQSKSYAEALFYAKFTLCYLASLVIASALMAGVMAQTR